MTVPGAWVAALRLCGTDAAQNSTKYMTWRQLGLAAESGLPERILNCGLSPINVRAPTAHGKPLKSPQQLRQFCSGRGPFCPVRNGVN